MAKAWYEVFEGMYLDLTKEENYPLVELKDTE